MTSTVYIAKSVYGGDGLGRLGDGRVVFVPGAFAGESVKAEITEQKRSFVKARLVEVVDASPERTGFGPPPVPGMVYANLSEKGEIAAKGGQLAEFFTRARLLPGGGAADSARQGAAPQSGGLFPPPPPGAFLNYRNKAVYHFARQDGRWVLGYREEPSHRIQDIAEDPLVRPEINAKLPEMRRHVFALLTQGASAVRASVERQGNVTVRWSARSGVKWWIGEAPHDLVMKEVTCGTVFEVPSDGFYQVNPEAGEALAKAVVAEYGRCAEVAPDMLDLYCGVGVFGICCRPPRLVGIESGRAAVEFARRNAAAAGLGTARFYAEEVGRNLRRLRIDGRTTVLLDPPRGGLERDVAPFLARSRAPRIIYVSCDPATLTRDLRDLSAGYSVSRVAWFNMFPRTARFETLAVLERRATSRWRHGR